MVVLERPPAWQARTQVWLDIVNGWYYKPEGDRSLVVGGMHIGEEQRADPDQYAATPSFDETEAHAVAATQRFPILAEGETRRGWAGIYDVTPDGQPVIDAVAEVPGLFLAFGFSGHGFKLAPAVGVAVSQLVLAGRCASYDLTPFRLSRFAEGRPTRGAYAYSIVG